MESEIAWIIVVNLLLYFRTLRFKFVSDDFTVFYKPPKASNRFHKRWLQFTGQMKLKSKTFWIDRREGKWKLSIFETEEQEHLLAMLIHTAIGVLIYFAFGASPVSFVAALLYSVNPVNNQGTIWPGGRGYALPIACILGTLACPLLAPVLLFACTWYTIGFLAPLALIGSGHWYLLLWLPMVWAFHGIKYVTAIKNKAKLESFEADKAVLKFYKAVIVIKTFGFYLTLCLIPFRITFYHNFLQSMAGSQMHKARSIWDRYFWIGVLALGSMICYWTLVPWNSISWALLAFTVTILPFCNFVRANQEIAERFCALPNVFLMYALAQVLALFNPIVAAAFFAFYATRTFYTLTMYKDEYFITELAIIEDPYAWWAWHCRAMKRWDTQSYKEAMILWVMARMLSPNEFKLLINLATVLRLMKNHAEADHFLKLAQENIVPGQEKEAAEFIKAHKDGKMPILL